ncbi:MAG: tetratricopeptide repeat protein [Acidobacteria bacterium]|nr:tetratricopeptide repeat protein [Acidobacteriota bacterium]
MGTIRIGDWRVDRDTGEASRGQDRARLEPKATVVLSTLASRRGELVTKAELLEAAWPRTAVSDDVLWRAIGQLRRLLEEDPSAPQWIETLPRRGYRLAPQPAPPQRAATARWRRWAVAAGISVVTLTALWQTAGSSTDPATTSATHTASDPRTWSADSFVQLGREAYAGRGRDDLIRAALLFQQALDRDPEHALAWAGMADAHSAKVSWHRGSGADAATALEAALRAISLDPDRAETHKALGFARGISGDVEGAALAYRRALDIQPDYLDAANNLALIEGTLGRYGATVEALLGVRASGQARAVVLNNLGEALIRLGAYDRAEDLLAQAATLVPDSVATAEGRVRAAWLAGNDALAQERVDAALAWAPGSAPLLNAAADIALTEGDWKRAAHLLDRSIEIDTRSRNAVATIRRAWLARSDGAESPELPFTTEALEASATQSRSWRTAALVAQFHAALGAPERAAEWLQEAAHRGYVDVGWLSLDPLFAETLRTPAASQLLDRERAQLEASRAEALAALNAATP